MEMGMGVSSTGLLGPELSRKWASDRDCSLCFIFREVINVVLKTRLLKSKYDARP